MRFSFLSISFLFLISSNDIIPTVKNSKPNVLFISVDDLRPEIGAYDSSIAHTPFIDQLASEGLQFDKAYCQQAICGPSRASVLTGIRPETSGIFHNYIKFRDVNPNVVTLPQHFKNNGYETVYMGKIFHHGDLDDEKSWSRLPAYDSLTAKGIARPVGFALQENVTARQKARKNMFETYGDVAKYGLAMGMAYEAADVPDNTYADGYHTDLAIATMNEMLTDRNKPFFLGLGFNKPHLNWVAPKKYWDLYERDDIELSSQTQPPTHGAAMGLHPSFELRVRSNIPKTGPIDNELAITLKHAYLACVSYVDAQIGKILNALKDSGEYQNTIIILWSDHGFHLGEMGIWGKATNYEVATRVPMIICTPEMKSLGARTNALVELVDIYPTLSELAKLPLPKHLEGQSFVPLLDNPKLEWKKAVFSQFPTPALREWGAYPLRPAMRETFFGPLLHTLEQKIQTQQKEKWDRDLFENNLMGYAMKTQDYKLILWKEISNPQKKSLFVELYDHRNDPNETINIASEKPELTNKLVQQFNNGWRGSLANNNHQ